jgi:hypothetical protein
MICLPFVDVSVQSTIKVQPLFLDVKHGAFARTRSLAFSTLHATHLLLSFSFLSKAHHRIPAPLGLQSRKSLVPVTALAACPAASTIVMSSGIRHRKCSLLLPPHQKSRTMHHAYFCSGTYIPMHPHHC